MRTAYKVRAYPDLEQAAMLRRTFGCVRVVWNRTLAWRQERWHTQAAPTNVPQANAYLTAMKQDPELAFLREVSSIPLQQVLRTQQKAYANFYAKRARHPRFKSRRGRQSAEFTRSAFRWREGELWLAKTSRPLQLAWSWPSVDRGALDPTTVTISCDPAGRWFATLQVDVADPEPLGTTETSVGVDLGVKDFAALSTGERIAPPDLRRKELRLARYQRMMTRKQKGSANRTKARVKVARAHAKVADARQDFLHKASTRLVREHDVVAIEDLAVRNMVKNRHLARVVIGSGWGEFRRQLTYKAERYGRTLVVIDRFYPSSKTCSSCGHLLASLSLGTRHWTCPGCGTRHDRDVNAAKNILAAGLAAGVPRDADACGVDVRPVGATRRRSAVKQEAQRVTAVPTRP